MAIADRLKYQREMLGLSPAEMAKKLEVDRSRYAQWENGEIVPGLERVKKIVKLLDVSYTFLLDDEPIVEQTPETKEGEKASYLKKTPKGWVCTAEHCAWRKDGYCPGTGCMKEFTERKERAT